jgi:DNA-binding transcriptional ArsR family regulator
MKPTISRETYHKNAQLFKILGSAKRLEIIFLLKKSDLPVAQLLKLVKLPKANLSQHLGLLRSAGLVTSRRKGLNVTYSLADSRITSMLTNNLF